MNVLTKWIQDEVPWYTLFDNNIVLIDDTREGLNTKLEHWRHTLEYQGFRLSRLKAEFKYGFKGEVANREEVIIDGVAMLRAEKFRHLGSIIVEKRDINENINQCIRVG